MESSGRPWLAFVLVCAAILALSWSLPEQSFRRYPGRKPVIFWHRWTGEWEKVVDGICDRFNASQTEYEVIPLSVPDGMADSKFLIAVAGDDPPDCMAEVNDVVPQWAESGLLLPLDSLMDAREWERQKGSIFPAALRIGMFRDRLYGLTVGMDIFALYYRPDFFRQAGLDPDHLPSSLEGLTDWAAKMDRTDANGELTRLGMLPWGLGNFAPVFGGGFYDWGKGELTLDTPQNMRALTWLAARRSRLGFDRVGRFEAAQNRSKGGGEGGWPLLSGSEAIVVDGQWRVQEARKLAPAFDYRTAPIPPAGGGLPGAGFVDGNVMLIPRSARDIQGAWAFIRFWSGLDHPERAAEFYTEGGWLPLNRAVEESPVYRGYLRRNLQFRTFVDLLESPNLYPVAPIPEGLYLSDRIGKAEEAACDGSASPKQAMDQLVREMRREARFRRDNGYAD